MQWGFCLEVVVRWRRRRRRRRVAARWEKKRVIRSDSDEAGSSLGASQGELTSSQNPISDHRSARPGRPSTCCSWWVAREAPRGFLIGWINQLARPSLQRHSGDLMHQCVADSSILQPLHTLLHPARMGRRIFSKC